MKKIVNILLVAPFILSSLYAFDYKLKAQKITKDTYMIEGKEEYFSVENGGDISNSAFIITKSGVVVIDTGSSYLYGKQQRELIEKITNKPIKFVINTHHHPDHFLGNKAYKDVDILASKYTQEHIKENGEMYIVNLINLTFDAMEDTDSVTPNIELKEKHIDLGDHDLKVTYLHGHTKDDIVLFDESTKTLFASDIVFNNRVAATPHADIKEWIKSLKELENVPFKILVSGHGKVSFSKEPIKQTIDYLEYVETTLKDAASKGLTLFEVLEQKIPNKFKGLSMIDEEFERTVINLYPKYENSVAK